MVSGAMKEWGGILVFLDVFWGIIQVLGVWGTVALMIVVTVVAMVVGFFFAEPSPEMEAAHRIATDDADEVMKRAINEAS